MQKLNPLELYQLRRYCRKYGLDFQEVDSTLTYAECKKHLKSLVHMLFQSLDTFELARMASLQVEYIENHALTYYASCRVGGETKSEEVGDPDTSPQRFSLKTMTSVGFSLSSYAKRQPAFPDPSMNKTRQTQRKT